jgi:hypothetical protein
MWFFHCHIDWHMTMGMGLVFDVESETVERYPEDMPLCGDAVTADVYRKDSSGGGQEEEEAAAAGFSSGEVAGVALGTSFVSLIVAAGGVYVYMYVFVASNKGGEARHQVAEMTDSPLQNEDRHL